MYFHIFSQLRRMRFLLHLPPIFWRSRTHGQTTASRTFPLRAGLKSLLIGLLIMLYGVIPGTVSAQNSVIQPLGDSPLYGTYCTVSGGLSLQAAPYTGTFTVDVPGTPVAAYWVWAGRSHSQPHAGDSTISIDRNGTGPVALVAQQALSSAEPNFTWYTYAWEDQSLDTVGTGSNSYSVSDFNINGNYDENHGVSLIVVYEDLTCPYSEVFVHFGLDSYRHTRPEAEFGPTSEVLCLSVTPSTQPRTMAFEVVVGGVMNETRNHAIWYDTGVGDTPGQLVDESFATEIPDPLNNVPGPQWDMYGDQLVLNSNDEYACMQLESRPDDNGDSAVWVATVAQVALHVGSIGDTVWYDDNGNGQFDSHESGMSGVSVVLYNEQGSELDRMITDANGFYTFGNLPSARYTVAVDPLTLSADLDLQTYELDGTPDGNTAVALETGQDRDDVDFGYQRLGSIGDRVWHDWNGNGIQEAGEPGMGEATVNLLQNNTVINTTQTEPNGIYGFDGLISGTYRVQFVAPGDYQTSPQNAGAEDVDSDAAPGTGLSDPITLTPGADMDTVDAGFYKLIDLSLTKTSENDLVEAGSQNIFTIEVTNSGPSVATGITVSDQLPAGLTFLAAVTSQGAYDEASGIWSVGTLQVGQTALLQLVTLVAETGTYANSAQVMVANELDKDSTPGNNDPTEDDQSSATVGTIELGSLGDRVWLDANANGLQDGGEPGYPGIFVTLYSADGTPVDAERTDETGGYLFSELRPGIYSIGFSLPQGLYAFSPRNEGDNDAVDSDVDASTNRTPPIQVDAGESDRTWDAGIYPLPLLSIEKTDHDIKAQPGGNIAYTLVYTNSGPGDAYNVVITEQVPENTTFNAAESSPNWHCEHGSTAAGTLCHYALGTVPAGTSGSLALSFVVTVDAPLPQEITTILNTVRITHDDNGNNPPGGQGDDVEETPLIPTALDEGEEPDALSASIFLPMVTK